MAITEASTPARRLMEFTLDFLAYLDVPAGRVTGLIGPNGAGKTTIVNLITGMLALSAGRIVFDGRDISALSADRISRLGFARTFQNIRLFKEASVVDNLLIGFHKLQQSSLVSNILGLPAARAETTRIRALAHDLLITSGVYALTAVTAQTDARVLASELVSAPVIRAPSASKSDVANARGYPVDRATACAA